MLMERAESLLAEGWDLFLAGQTAAARDRYLVAHESAHDPFLRGLILLRLALAQEYLGEIEHSIETTERALGSFPEVSAERVNALFSLSHRLLTAGDSVRAYQVALDAVSLARDEAIPDNVRANAFINQGNAALTTGRPREATHAYEQAHRLFVALDDPAGVAAALSSLGNVRQAARDMAGARTLYEEALEAARASGQWMTENDALTNLGRVVYELGDVTGALSHFEAARTAARQRSHLARLALTAYDVGLMRENLNDFDGAVEAYRESYEVVSRQGPPPLQLRVLRSLLNGLRRCDRRAEVLSLRRTALRLARRCVDHEAVLEVLDNVAIVHAKNHALPSALDYWESALALGRRLGSRQRETSILENMRRIYQLRGRPDLAVTMAEQLVGVYHEAGRRTEEAWSLTSMAQLLTAAGLAGEAEAPLRAAETLARELDHGMMLGVITGTRANAMLARGDAHGALPLFEQALGMLATHGDADAQSVTLANMANAFDAIGDPVRAHACRRDMETLRLDVPNEED